MDQLTPNDGQILDKKPAIVVLSASGLELARKIARTVSVLHQGSLLAEGTMDEVQNNPDVIEVYLGKDAGAFGAEG